jgi:hypothetical protein
MPCSTGKILDRLGGGIDVLARGERMLEIGCPPDAKMALFRDLGDAWQVVEDVKIETPGLPALYSRLVEREEGR